MDKTELVKIEERLLELTKRGPATGGLNMSQEASACAGLAILEAVREFDSSSRRYGKILIWLTLVLAVLTGVLVVLTSLLMRHG